MGPRGLARGCRAPRRGMSRSPGFNGAAGVGPRMRVCNLTWPAELQASMGPRGLARGCVSSLTNSAPSVALQWGRGGWPADGIHDHQRGSPSSRLQWGRGGWPADGRNDASLAGQIHASMGPRGLARGCGQLASHPTIARWLQWGRGGWPADEAPVHFHDGRELASMGPRGLARGCCLDTARR